MFVLTRLGSWLKCTCADVKHLRGGKNATDESRLCWWCFLLVMCAVVFWGCGTRSEGRTSDVAVQRSELHRGVPITAQDLRAVAGIFATNRSDLENWCTGTLIAPRVLLTAGHCSYTTNPNNYRPARGHVYARFAAPNGDPRLEHGAQEIRVDGMVAHPGRYQLPGKNCSPIENYVEHDMALMHLVSAPEGIEPIPVVVARHDISSALKVFPGLVGFPKLNDFLDGREELPSEGFGIPKVRYVGLPNLTYAGWGGGSTFWEESQGGDMGTAQIKARHHTPRFWTDCDGEDRKDTVEGIVSWAGKNSGNRAYSDHGDSGGPVLVGVGDGVALFPTPPTAIPSWYGMGDRRYVIGVSSLTAHGLILGGPCEDGCSENERCVVRGDERLCARSCTQDSHCSNISGGVCDPGPGGNFCYGSWSYYAPTFTFENGTWLQQRLGDFDGDGVHNDIDNCPGVKNAGVKKTDRQPNCNAIAEIERNAVVLGDACDPVPCPGAEPVDNFAVELPPSSVPQPKEFVNTTRRVVSNIIRHNLTGSRNMVNAFPMA